MPSISLSGSTFYLGQTSYGGDNSVSSVFNVDNAETSTIQMVSDPSSTDNPVYSG